MIASCATMQVPPPQPQFHDRELLQGSRDGLDIRVRPIEGLDQYLQLFDDDLPRIGIVALWVEVQNNRTTPIDLRPDTWGLRTGNREFVAIGVAKLFARYYDARGIRMYTEGMDASARRNMERVAFPAGPIQPSLKRSGFLFFPIDPGLASGWIRGAVLLARNIQLDPRSKATLEIALTHGDSRS